MAVLSFDIDGTLVNSTDRLMSCMENGKVDWKCFLDCGKLHMDQPIPFNISIINKAIRSGLTVILVTGRPERMRECTLSQLMKFGVNVSGIRVLVMRRDYDDRPDPEYKVDALAGVGLLDVIHCDDNEDTVNSLIRHGFKAMLASNCDSINSYLSP